MGAGCSGKDNSKRGMRSSEPVLDFSMLKTEFMTNLPNRFGKKEADDCKYGNSTFENLNNSCYLAAVLQVLAHTQPLAEYIASRTFESDGCKPANLDFESLEALRGITDVMTTVWGEVYDIVVPKLMHRVIKKLRPNFDNDKQQDAHEAFIVLLEKLHMCLNACADKKPIEIAWGEQVSAESEWLSHIEMNCSVIVDLFHGLMKSTLRCLRCGHISTKFDVFSTIDLALSENTRSLKGCLDEFLSPETLSKAWNCPKCEIKVDCIKKLDFVRIPPILTFAFKRYSYPTTKTAHRIICPVIDFNFDDFMTDSTPSTFDMYAKVVHTGSAESGHYHVLTKHHKTQKWKKLDDVDSENVGVEALEGYNEDTYMLFYYNKSLTNYKRQILTRKKSTLDKPTQDTASTQSDSIIMRKSVFEERKDTTRVNEKPDIPVIVSAVEEDMEDFNSADELDPPSMQFSGISRHPVKRSNGDLRGLEQQILLSN